MLVEPSIAPNVEFPVSWPTPVGCWKLVSPVDVNPSVWNLIVPSPLLVRVMEPVAPPIPIMSALPAEPHRSGPASNASPARSFLLMILSPKDQNLYSGTAQVLLLCNL